MTTSEAAEQTSPEAPKLGLAAQLTRFVLVGGFSALVDYGTYQLFLALGMWVHPAKALGFVFGTTTAYFLNKRFTFQAAPAGAGRLGGFILLYGVTFFVNVGVNALALALLPASALKITIAWVIAQATATAINFVMLRLVVFKPQ
ncbi:GtrA family protein [Allokutzneria sp. NRRL B-24872]|uniref:GtrA family protein n=1 Tax=Allokutzneria sp. NRRL B-24872 TaxID=1137961 RepID=UPI0027380C15|nr:GtrA family protein [Allokutzneria sp. NRRL B-24872]